MGDSVGLIIDIVDIFDIVDVINIIDVSDIVDVLDDKAKLLINRSTIDTGPAGIRSQAYLCL